MLALCFSNGPRYVYVYFFLQSRQFDDRSSAFAAVHLYFSVHDVIPQRLDQRSCCLVPAGFVLSYLYAQHIAPYVRVFFLLAAMLSTRFG